MNKTYITLFQELSRAASVLAEKVMEYNHKMNDEKGTQTAEKMRDSYNDLYDNLKTENYIITRADFARLFLGAIIVTKNLESRIENEKKSLQGYNIDIIPKLNRIIEETQNDEEALELANEIFQVNT